MFYENFMRLCEKMGKSPTAVCIELGLSSGAHTFWKNGALPRTTTIIKVADYFGVTVQAMTGETPTAKPTQHTPQPSTLETVLAPQSLKVAMAYQFARPEIQTAINVLLGIQEDDKSKSERA